jgi:peptidoglycan/xylan/chitin deacetylase (PgdA/CDA1 family)
MNFYIQQPWGKISAPSVEPKTQTPPLFVPNPDRKPERGRTGVLVISLDFELHWGVRDHIPLHETERARLLAARAGVPRILDLFERFSVHATWATVGLLFARSREEAESFIPEQRPHYQDPRLDPYRERLGRDEHDDPFHFAPSLIAQISERPGQEIGSHSFSHYCCMEAGQTAADFEADLKSAIAIAANSGYSLRSYVFPRNQVNPSYLSYLERGGMQAYRANESAGSKKSAAFSEQLRPHHRIIRLLDSYIDIHGDQTLEWHDDDPALMPIPASRFLRSYRSSFRQLERLLLQRIGKAMKHAAEHGGVFHLWWHPEDFAGDIDQNLRLLRCVLEILDQCRDQHGMVSFSMAELFQQSRLTRS